MKFERLERRQLQRDGLCLTYYDEARGRVSVVFQHGLCGSAQQTAEAFPDAEDLRLLTLECRGHGSSAAGMPEGLSIASFAADAVAMIEFEKLAPVILGGISMGAAIALRIAARRPDLVRALILARPAWVSEPAPDNMQPNAEVGELLANLAPEPARDRFEHGATAQRLAVEAPDNLASLRGFFGREPQVVTAALLQRISADGPGLTADEVRAITVHAVVIGNAADAIHPLAHARSLAALLPQAQLVEITPKSVSREMYVKDMQTTLLQFIRTLPS